MWAPESDLTEIQVGRWFMLSFLHHVYKRWPRMIYRDPYAPASLRSPITRLFRYLNALILPTVSPGFYVKSPFRRLAVCIQPKTCIVSCLAALFCVHYTQVCHICQADISRNGYFSSPWGSAGLRAVSRQHPSSRILYYILRNCSGGSSLPNRQINDHLPIKLP